MLVAMTNLGDKRSLHRFCRSSKFEVTRFRAIGHHRVPRWQSVKSHCTYVKLVARDALFDMQCWQSPPSRAPFCRCAQPGLPLFKKDERNTHVMICELGLLKVESGSFSTQS